MPAVFYRDVRSSYPKAIKADGMYITDERGSLYLDMSGGAASASLGHSHEMVLQAMHDQIDSIAYAHSGFFTTDPQEQLAACIASEFGEEGAHVYFNSGGSEANETAMKIAWQYWRQLGLKSKTKIISREHSYHGNTLGALSVSGNAKRRQTMGRILMDWPRISACHYYRFGNEHNREADYVNHLVNEFQALVSSEGSETIAAFIAEPIVGASLGAVCGAEGYLKRIRDICTENNILFIADEVMCGSGRTSTYFAHTQENIIPDIVTMGKGIATGYQPLAATIVRGHVHQLFKDNDGFSHGHTYVGHATACAAGLAVYNAINQCNLLNNVGHMGRVLMDELHAAFDDHP